MTKATAIIKQELAVKYPEVKFSVRRSSATAVHVLHNVTDLTWRTELDQWLRRFEDWNSYRVEYVIEQVVA
jgi:hypothetical protein